MKVGPRDDERDGVAGGSSLCKLLPGRVIEAVRDDRDDDFLERRSRTRERGRERRGEKKSLQ